MVARSNDRREEVVSDAVPDVARLGDLLPQILQRYGYASPDVSAVNVSAVNATTGERRFGGPETNRPGGSFERRRVG